MSERGVFAVDRGVFEHPMFAPEPFTEREAWLWMVGAAAWRACKVRVGRATIDIVRGQLAFATRFMASRWKWSEARVRRFLKRLQSDAMVSIQTTRESTLITICNYDKYAFGRRTDDAQIDAPNDTTSTHPRRKEEEPKNLRTEDSEANASAADAAPAGQPVYSDSRHELWGEGVAILRQLGEPAKSARSNIGRWLKSSRDDAATVLGAIQRARDNRVIDPIPWITQALRTDANGQSPYQVRTAGAAGRQATGQDAILTGMGNLAARVRDRIAAEERERDLADRGDAAGVTDPRLI